MILGECNHCAAPIELTGNLGSLLSGNSYYCSYCGHPGPGLTAVLGRRIRSLLASDGDSEELVTEDQAG